MSRFEPDRACLFPNRIAPARWGTNQIALPMKQPRQPPYRIALWMIVVPTNNTRVALVGARTGSRWPRFGPQDRLVRCQILVMARRCAGSSGSFGLTSFFLRPETRNLLESLMFFCLLRNRSSIKPWGKPSMAARNHSPVRLLTSSTHASRSCLWGGWAESRSNKISK